jgi:RNA polymerase sigma-70 factor (ECF subfamily)
VSELTDFTQFIHRIRAGDQAAAAEMVHRYEPLIRRVVRLKLEDRRLERLFDSMDICQSVLGSFFVRVAAGQYDLDRPEQLVRLLVTMARNKLAGAARRQNRGRRDHRRLDAGGPERLARLADPTPDPGEQVAGRELLDRFQAILSEEERQLVDLRNHGYGWDEIAARLGGSPNARRMQLARAVERGVRQLGLDEDADG